MDVVNTGVVVRKYRLSEKSSNIEGVILGTICYVMYSKQYKRASFTKYHRPRLYYTATVDCICHSEIC